MANLTNSTVDLVRVTRGHAMWSVSCLLLSLLAASHQLSIDKFEVPPSESEGSDVEFKCTYSLDASDGKAEPYVKWWFYPTYHNDDKPVLVYQRLQHEEPYLHKDFEKSGTKDNIILKDAKYTYSGRYMCEASGYNEKRVSADLVIYSKGTGPLLNITEVADGADEDEDNDLLVVCRAGDVTPEAELLISTNGRPLSGIVQDNDTISDGLYNLTANVTVSKSDLEGVEVRCELLFPNKEFPHSPFVDTETYSSTGCIRTSVDRWLSIAAVMMVLQSLMQTSN
ncbi:uncharacterized protein LOC128676332 isoform X2 [Plodia interpunctella]|uniref:uncharacterized protein LOC128676332 isoform X2 n=1 Tax=Plodia interpunctella TaxID=58824 RepID=UPI002368C385|nr:uncharacterized protein LOC128676332 isoform X2 [Plodia interpunctella]